MITEIKEAAKAGDSLGGVVEVLGLRGAPRPRVPRPLGPQDRRAPRPGAHEHPGHEGRRDRRRVRGRRSAGERCPRRDRVGAARGPEGAPLQGGTYERASDRAGGTEGGMTTGALLVARVAMKPLASLNRPVLRTVDTETKEETVSFKERTDVTAVPAAGRGGRDDGGARPGRGGAAEVRRRLAARAGPQPPGVPRPAPVCPDGFRTPPRPRRDDGGGQELGRSPRRPAPRPAVSSTPTSSSRRTAGSHRGRDLRHRG